MILNEISNSYFLRYIPLTDQISLSDCLYILRYCAIYVLHLFPSRWRQILKLALASLAVFLYDERSRCENLNILSMRRVLKVN